MSTREKPRRTGIGSGLPCRGGYQSKTPFKQRPAFLTGACKRHLNRTLPTLSWLSCGVSLVKRLLFRAARNSPAKFAAEKHWTLTQSLPLLSNPVFIPYYLTISMMPFIVGRNAKNLYSSVATCLQSVGFSMPLSRVLFLLWRLMPLWRLCADTYRVLIIMPYTALGQLRLLGL